MIIKPSDIHVMKKERVCNTFDGKVTDSIHIEMLGTTFECNELSGYETDSNVKVEVDFEKIELMDNQEDGLLTGCVRFILYKGDHYHITVVTEKGEELYVDTNDIWDIGDIVGINILPDSLIINKA